MDSPICSYHSELPGTTVLVPLEIMEWESGVIFISLTNSYSITCIENYLNFKVFKKTLLKLFLHGLYQKSFCFYNLINLIPGHLIVPSMLQGVKVALLRDYQAFLVIMFSLFHVLSFPYSQTISLCWLSLPSVMFVCFMRLYLFCFTWTLTPSTIHFQFNASSWGCCQETSHS